MIAVVGNVCCAISINVQMFITFRAISAIGSSAVRTPYKKKTTDKISLF